jgi:ADP-ribosylglycohydrolase
MHTSITSENGDDRLRFPARTNKAITVDTVLAVALGGAFADALGTPFETIPRGEILAIPDRFTKFHDPCRNEFIRDYVTREGLPRPQPGTTSDDTDLTCAVGSALLMAGGCDLRAMIFWHVKAAEERPHIGWGPQVERAIDLLSQRVSYCQSGAINAADFRTGNGALMKLSFLGLYHELCAIPDQTAASDVEALTIMTHRSSTAVQASLAYLALFRECLRQTPESFDSQACLRHVLASALIGEGVLPDLQGPVRVAERLRPLQEMERLVAPEDYLARWGEPDSNVLNCLPAVVYTVLRAVEEGWDQFEAIKQAIDLGGDTDSNAAMVAACMGALAGTAAALPQNLLGQLISLTQVEELAQRFAARFVQKGPRTELANSN